MRVQAVCFDYGGTLDGEGSHWLVRFLHCYEDAGVRLPFERFRDAFDYATHCGYADPRVSGLDLQALIEFHVARQMERLGVEDLRVAARVVTAFVHASRSALEDSRVVLERLHRRVALGVVSNFYGNVARVLRDAGVAPLLAAIVDSARVGVSKPNPAIFTLAVRRLGCEPGAALHVGDSFEKDIVGARAAGLRTAWLTGAGEGPCPAPELVDIRLSRLAELEAVVE
ncbi:MAG: HAD family hydrolase [Candidatus Binatia bacterium]